MELNAEGGASFEQLQDLIKKECDKRDKNIDPWNKNTINYKNRSNTRNPQKLANKGPTWRLKQKEITTKQTAEGCQTNVADPPQDNAPNHPPANTEKPTVPTMTQQATTWKNQKGTDARDRNRRKSFLPPIGTGHDSHRKQNKATIWIYRRPKQNTPT